jgi:uncharacterized protein
MHFLVTSLDRPDCEELRHRLRPAHLGFLHGSHTGLTVALAGPLLADDGITMIGSLIVVDAQDEEVVRRFSLDDPFKKAGLFETTTIRRWKWTYGNADSK